MDSLPPWALERFQNLSPSQQETIMNLAMKAMQNPYYIPYVTIVINWQLIYLPHFVKLFLILPLEMFEYDNETPRYSMTGESIQAKRGISNTYAGFLKRLGSCHLNAFEAFGPYVAAILVAKASKVKGDAVQKLAVQYTILRMAYFALYVGGVNKWISYVRTLVWAGAFLKNLEIFQLALS